MNTEHYISNVWIDCAESFDSMVTSFHWNL